MKRTRLRKMLQEYSPKAFEEVQSKNHILAFMESHEDCFERTLSIGHITASAWLVNKDKTKALLMHHTRLNKWLQLGGHCDGNPDVLSVAIREAQEESGMNAIVALDTSIFDIDVHLYPAHSREPEHYHYDITFLLQVISDEQPVANSESKGLQWVSANLADLPACDSSVLRKFNKWVALET